MPLDHDDSDSEKDGENREELEEYVHDSAKQMVGAPKQGELFNAKKKQGKSLANLRILVSCGNLYLSYPCG